MIHELSVSREYLSLLYITHLAMLQFYIKPLKSSGSCVDQLILTEDTPCIFFGGGTEYLSII
jgi:hypothetical protein